ncbi:FAD/NAD(P)-binding domain-containing protein [Guyanagaster necrorhizus]|uniref:FAD/NAD(P)-binding domain-containing protein n=1 Tax=Guyanagaster necrorhizus TaxID=856835 RepID=A0A9P7VYF0_9AGAR|nr:FAD/NAD(P)-binding domain-containing protein [Guyanagaster necrorhizus MCA 3950]KAG7449866.1 FAD/NAD(P)-binding domain-containing protein [Guyanagaster necrorhizus MCA 3950]
MKVCIIGAGMGGLAASIALQQDGHQTVVYERVSDLRPVGAAISVWCNGVKVLARLGLLKEVERVSGQMNRMSYRKWDTGEVYCDFSLLPLYEEVKQRAYPIARAELQRMLLDANAPAPIHLQKRAVSYSTSQDGITVSFEDGTIETADFVVIADGTHSKLRNQITKAEIQRDYVGYVNWNGPIEMKEFEGLISSDNWTQFVGEGKRVSFMPMSATHYYFFLDVPLPLSSAPKRPEEYRASLTKHFGHWHPTVQKLVERLDPSKVARVEIHDTKTLPTLVDLESGRALLIGDAAHATCPDLGQGGCQAFEDAFVLQQLFREHRVSPASASAKPDVEVLRAVLRDFQDQRGERTAELVLRARKRSGVTHQLGEPQETLDWYEELKTEDGTGIMRGMIKTILGAPAQLDH